MAGAAEQGRPDEVGSHADTRPSRFVPQPACVPLDNGSGWTKKLALHGNCSRFDEGLLPKIRIY